MDGRYYTLYLKYRPLDLGLDPHSESGSGSRCQNIDSKSQRKCLIIGYVEPLIDFVPVIF
jgi:hypothetical protein